jgi:hypothetical protein
MRPMKTWLTVIAVFCIVPGWVLVSNPPRQVESLTRSSHVDFTRPELWIGMVLLAVGVSYFAVRLMNRVE